MALVEIMPVSRCLLALRRFVRSRLSTTLPLGGALLILLYGAGCGHDDGTTAFETLKQQIQSQDEAVRRLKAAHLVAEGRRGFLVAGDSITLEQRDTIQRQNVSRERAFALIAARTHRKPEDVAALFSDQAQRHDGQTVPHAN